MSMICGFELSLRLSIGADLIINNEPPVLLLDSHDYQLKMYLDEDILNHQNMTQPINWTVTNVEIKHHQLTIHQVNRNKHPQKNNQEYFIVTPSNHQTNQSSTNHNFIFIFQCNLQVDHKYVKVYYQKAFIHFSLYLISKVKFIKNQKLEKIIKNNKNDWGFLSMDSSERILLQGKKTNFPIIGIWQKNNSDLNDFEVFYELIAYLKKKQSNKCKFTYEKEQYFYFVQIKHENPVPELYLVNWKQKDALILSNSYEKQTSYVDGKFLFDSSQLEANSFMEFTLRSNQKQLERLIDYSGSPVKYNNETLEMALMKNTSNQNSPRFHHHTEDYQSECIQLREKVQQQEIEIRQLKSLLGKMQNQMKNWMVEKNINESDSKPKKEMIEFDSSAKVCIPKKKLTQSDLKTNSASTKYKKSEESSSGSMDLVEMFRKASKSILIGGKDQIYPEDQMEPWENLEIIEGD